MLLIFTFRQQSFILHLVILLFFLSIGGVLSSCSTIPNLSKTLDEQLVNREQISNFSAVGKLAIKAGNKALQTRFYWQEGANRTNIILETPIGISIGKVERKAGKFAKYIFASADGEINFSASSIEDILIATIAGNNLGITSLPNGIVKDLLLSRNLAKWEGWRDENQQIQQINWAIELKNNNDKNFSNIYKIPEFVKIYNQDFSVRIFIERWADIR